jgi:hypothetical protein
MDIMALLNCSINFVLFCIMSVQFRKTFHKVLGTKQIINKYFASSPEVIIFVRLSFRTYSFT